MQKSLLTLSSLLIALPLAAQQHIGEVAPDQGGADPMAGSFATYGKGCKGSGFSYGAPVELPKAFASSFGNSNNTIPFTWSPCRYQQVFLGSEIGTAPVFVAMGLRQDNGFANRPATISELEIWLGGTTFDNNTLTTTFDNNFNSKSASKRLVFKRRNFAVPFMPPNRPTNPNEYFFKIPFDGPWVNNLATDNLLLEVKLHSNSNNNRLLAVPLDAASGSGVTTTRLYGLSTPNDPTGSLGRNYGLIAAFYGIGAVSTPVPTVHHTSLPSLGTSFHYGLSRGNPGARAFQVFGASNTSSGSLTLPFDMTIIGAPSCFLLASLDVVLPVTLGPGGDFAGTLPIPSNSSLAGKNLYLQFLVLDGANSLGIVSSNGGALTLN